MIDEATWAKMRTEERRQIAYHEAGHAVAVALFVGPSHIVRVDIVGDKHLAGVCQSERRDIPRSPNQYRTHSELSYRILKHGIELMMGPFCEFRARKEEWAIHQVIDEDEWDDEGPLTDVGAMFNSISLLPQGERRRMLKRIEYWTAEFGNHPLIAQAVNCLAAELIEVDVLEGERAAEIILATVGNVSHLGALGPKWRRLEMAAFPELKTLKQAGSKTVRKPRATNTP